MILHTFINILMKKFLGNNLVNRFSYVSLTICKNTISLKLFPSLPFVTQCLIRVAIIEVHRTAMASYLLNLI